ncbi:MAG: hypothetical protein Q9222_001783 [Ikaeria aurantiellina]
MGLSASRKRGKLSKDPNNTAWTRSASRFGQKLLQSQGWTPGSSLGASSASGTNTPARTSHIKVTLRDDNLGIGASTGRGSDESPTTGLDGLQNLLGRLNGKDAQLLQNEQKSRQQTREHIYAGRRLKFDNFVSGGFLVGDRTQQQMESAPTESISTISPDASSLKTVHKNKSVKRKPDKPKAAPAKEASDAMQRPSLKPTSSERPPPSFIQNDAIETSPSRLRTTDNDMPELHSREEREHKARRRAKKAEKLRVKEPKGRKQQSEPDLTATVRERNEGNLGERHAVRRRMIQQKKMSLANHEALNEILMIRSPAAELA